MNDFNIQAASLMSGVSVHQIRAWEKRYQALTPKRLGNNFRSYSQEDVTRLKLLGHLTRHGIAISKIAGVETQELLKQYESFEIEEAKSPLPPPNAETKDKLDLLMNFLSVKRFDLIAHEVLKLKTLASVTGILIPLMKCLVNDPYVYADNDSKQLLKMLIDETSRISSHGHIR
jgi:DNA-binding transcriptional MerR regulator